MAKKFSFNPKHPERICWSCGKYCAVVSLQCGNGSDRTQHPSELFGDDWFANEMI
jgi:predicted P-loop ATPase